MSWSPVRLCALMLVLGFGVAAREVAATGRAGAVGGIGPCELARGGAVGAGAGAAVVLKSAAAGEPGKGWSSRSCAHSWSKPGPGTRRAASAGS
jgi:hypothetical protein